ncbi:MAG TPA: response regulator, partial [Candidatus Polarisedimenticolia bacterium]|nr:response regulator [Candidatus Polarisedimenticolia bacterium]
LSVVYGIVRNHRGNLTITSTPGLGTTVRIYLPVLDRARRAARAAPPSPAPTRPGAPAPGSDRQPAVPSPFERIRVIEVDRRRPRQGAPDVPPPAPPRAPSAPQAPPAGTAPPVRPPAPPAGAPQTTAAAARPVPPAARKEAVAMPAPAPGRNGGKARILVIDDEAAIRAMARDILETGGYEVVTAVDGVDALEVYRQEWGRIDLVLLDMVMPRMGGLETFRRLFGMDRTVRVLLCSGFADNEQTQKAIKEGAQGLLQKPFAVSDLLSRIGRILTPR